MTRFFFLCMALMLSAAANAAVPQLEIIACCHCGEDLPCGDCSDNGCCQEASCCEGCFAKVEPGTKGKHCWNVECDKICIPAIRFPWEAGGSPLTCFSWLKKRSNSACCDTRSGDCADICCATCIKPLCGEVRYVRDLVKEKYEVNGCEWKWQIRRMPPCGKYNGCCNALDLK